MAMTLWGMLQLNNPPEEARTAVLSLVANKAVAVHPRLARTLKAPRSHRVSAEKDSSAVISEEMGFLDSINEEKMVGGERWSISSATEHEKAASWGVWLLGGEWLGTLKREQFIGDSEKVKDVLGCAFMWERFKRNIRSRWRCTTVFSPCLPI